MILAGWFRCGTKLLHTYRSRLVLCTFALAYVVVRRYYSNTYLVLVPDLAEREDGRPEVL